MIAYLLRRLFLIPITLLCILLVNFVILNFAPDDPSTISFSADGSQRADQAQGGAGDEQYLIFREHYGLTLPVLFNFWPRTSHSSALKTLQRLASEELPPKKHNLLRIRFGDRSRYILPLLLDLAEDLSLPESVRSLATHFFIRGATRMGAVGPTAQRDLNRKIARDNHYLRQDRTLPELRSWFEENAEHYGSAVIFSHTRLFRYLTRVFTLDFGTLRNDANRTVISEVASRLQISLTLAFFPMLLAFGICQILGFTMALFRGRWPDISLNILCLSLYAIPIFVVAPFLIEKVALRYSLPISGFHSPDRLYEGLTSLQRIQDISLHVFLPLIAVMYGMVAVQSRLSRTAVLEVLGQDYVRTARAKGVPPLPLLVRHVGRNAAITIVTSLAASLGVILGGSLIVETIFGIDGFGRFFYEAIQNRDFNVILFSAIIGSTLALVGYLLADIAYTVLDPRVTLE